MKVQRNVPGTSDALKVRGVKLLLVGRDDEFEDNATHRPAIGESRIHPGSGEDSAAKVDATKAGSLVVRSLVVRVLWSDGTGTFAGPAAFQSNSPV